MSVVPVVGSRGAGARESGKDRSQSGQGARTSAVVGR